MPGNPSKPIYKGRLYCLDHQGKPQWPAPVAIKNQFLLANQPENLPLFTFASQIFVQNFNGGGQYKASILCVDKRNGQKVYKKSFPNQTGIFNVAGDAEKKTVDLTMHQTTITLTYTDKPIPPPSAEKPKSAKSTAEGKAVLDLWNGIQKTIGLDADESDSED
jgi:hypothetical protein